MSVHKKRKNISNGETSTLDGQRISKNNDLIHLIGTADELNSHLGLVKAMYDGKETKQFIEKIQKDIMKLMSHVSDLKNENYFFSKGDTDVFEKEIDSLSAGQRNLNQFVLPGSSAMEAQIHITRTIARRTERLFYALDDRQMLCQYAGAYLNKLSDYLFVLSQHKNLF
ncbi:MAG: cob(I)yrinic acid a,c-diamide adenosyltransferase [Treponema sp.]|jgi:cob(I)alamin adenosyltransferase|nr:cob(I)yrinic acid a,c-diamide adenosyltransferase [Treponema sp.]